MQLDIFEHGREVMLRNDAVDALERRDASAARQACDRLDGMDTRRPLGRDGQG